MDEAHEYLGGNDIRNHTNMLETISEYPLQKIWVTATLPIRPDLTGTLCSLAYIPNNVRVLREPTDRPEISHHLVPRPTTTGRGVLEITKELALQLESRLGHDDRMIVFCMSTTDTQSLASDLRAARHYTGQEKFGEGDTAEENIAAWEAGRKRTIVATAGLLQGIHFPNVRFVIFNEGTWGIIAYAQGAGRTGRNGQRSDVFLVRNRNDPTISRPNGRPDVTGAHSLQDYMTRDQDCLRYRITYAMDKIPTSCEDIPGCARCGNCDPDNEWQVLCRRAAAVSTARTDIPGIAARSHSSKALITSTMQSGHTDHSGESH